MCGIAAAASAGGEAAMFCEPAGVCTGLSARRCIKAGGKLTDGQHVARQHYSISRPHLDAAERPGEVALERAACKLLADAAVAQQSELLHGWSFGQDRRCAAQAMGLDILQHQSRHVLLPLPAKHYLDIIERSFLPLSALELFSHATKS